MLLQTKQKTEANMTITSKNQPLTAYIQKQKFCLTESVKNLNCLNFQRDELESCIIAFDSDKKQFVEKDSFESGFMKHIIPQILRSFKTITERSNPHIKKALVWDLGQDAANWHLADESERKNDLGVDMKVVNENNGDVSFTSPKAGRIWSFKFRTQKVQNTRWNLEHNLSEIEIMTVTVEVYHNGPVGRSTSDES